MQRLQVAQTLERLRSHWTFHRMHCELRRCVQDGNLRGHSLQGAAGIAQIPGEAIVVAIEMAGGAGDGAVAGKARVIKKTATLANDRRRGVEGANVLFGLNESRGSV